MNILLILIVVLLLFGGLGGIGYHNGWVQPGFSLYGGSGLVLIVIVVLLVLLLR